MMWIVTILSLTEDLTTLKGSVKEEAKPLNQARHVQSHHRRRTEEIVRRMSSS
jgi:hypothetical protein